MKSFKSILLGLAMAALVLSCTSEAIYTAGTYTGEGQGHGGTIKVAVTVDDTSIKSIEVTENPESDLSLKPIENLIEQAIKANSGDIDAVSGASETSAGIITAIQSALSLASTGNAGAAATVVEEASASRENESTDIVIVGAGGAGLSAAVSAASNGAKVIVLEKMMMVGGNTNYATAGLNAGGTSIQAGLGIEDSKEVFYEDTMKGGKNLNNPELVKVLSENAPSTVDWLIGLGADLSDVGRMGGSTNNRTHRPTGGAAIGAHIVSVLDKNAETVADIRTENKVVALLHDGNKVTGVSVESPEGNYEITAKAVIIATGGFGADNDMVVKYKPELKGFGTTNAPGATGDALTLVQPLDVALVDMTQIQTHPTVVPVKNKMITEAVRGNGAILVNYEGKRFIDEMQTRDVVSEAILAQSTPKGVLFFDQGVRDSLSAIEKYAKAGLLTEGATIADVANAMGIDAATLEETVATYNSYVDSGVDADQNRADMPRSLKTGPFYMVEIGPAVHHCMGGLEIDTTTRVYNTSGEWVEGLFAAGEVTGGVHGANRLGGNAIADITIFGKIAGQSAADYIK